MVSKKPVVILLDNANHRSSLNDFAYGSDLLLRAKEKLYADIGDPTWLAAAAGYLLKAPTARQQKEDILFAIECLTAAGAQSGFALLGSSINTVGVLLVVDFEIRLGALGEIAADD
jgi:hypothetical protein